MTDAEIDRRLTDSARVTDDQLVQANLAESLDDLLVGTMALDTNERVQPQTPVLEKKRLARPLLAAASIVVILLMAAIAVETRSDGPDSSTAYASELIDFAERSPKILIDDVSWPVVRADETEYGGEMSFRSTSDGADLHWRSETLDELIQSRLVDNVDLGILPVLDTSARVIQYRSGEITALWEHDSTTLEFRAGPVDVDTFAALLRQLRTVDTGEWLDAMPPSVIDRTSQPDAIREILADIPVPADFVANDLDTSAVVSDEYQLKARVTGAAACAWLDQWFTATEAGNVPAATEAAAMLATSTEWTALLDIADEGRWSETVWQWADAVNGGPGVATGGGPQPPTRERSASALSCSDQGS